MGWLHGTKYFKIVISYAKFCNPTKSIQDGFDWQLEQARRILEGPAFAPIRMTLWKPSLGSETKQKPPGFLDQTKILLNNAFQIAGIAESMVLFSSLHLIYSI